MYWYTEHVTSHVGSARGTTVRPWDRDFRLKWPHSMQLGKIVVTAGHYNSLQPSTPSFLPHSTLQPILPPPPPSYLPPSGNPSSLQTLIPHTLLHHTARIPSPLPLHVAKTGRNHLNEEFTSLLPTGIGERF